MPKNQGSIRIVQILWSHQNWPKTQHDPNPKPPTSPKITTQQFGRNDPNHGPEYLSEYPWNLGILTKNSIGSTKTIAGRQTISTGKGAEKDEVSSIARNPSGSRSMQQKLVWSIWAAPRVSKGVTQKLAKDNNHGWEKRAHMNGDRLEEQRRKSIWDAGNVSFLEQSFLGRRGPRQILEGSWRPCAIPTKCEYSSFV